VFDLISAEYGWRDEEILEVPLCRLRQIADTIRRRQEQARNERLIVAEWQARSISSFVASAAGAWGDASELVRAAQELSITGDAQDEPRVPAPVRPRSGREEWEQAAQAQRDAEQRAESGRVDEAMAGVPAGVRVDELPEMAGVPVSGPQQQAGDAEVKGAGARIGAAEGLINALQRGIAPQ
jgi:hypothetical protein